MRTQHWPTAGSGRCGDDVARRQHGARGEGNHWRAHRHSLRPGDGFETAGRAVVRIARNPNTDANRHVWPTQGPPAASRPVLGMLAAWQALRFQGWLEKKPPSTQGLEMLVSTRYPRVRARKRQDASMTTTAQHPMTTDRATFFAVARGSFVPRTREDCAVCGRYRSMTQAHHIVPLAMQFDQGGGVVDHRHEWLCPTHHVAVHILINQMASLRDRASRTCINVIAEIDDVEELRRLLLIAGRAWS